ncbi:MAG: nitrilase-related carbon-nitrogen hydrolase, partial [bacterium]
SMVVDPFGEIVTRASEKEDDILVAEIDRDRVYAARRRYPMQRDRRPEVYRPLTDQIEEARHLS